MTEQARQTQRHYLEHLRSLYSDVIKWLPKGAAHSRGRTTLNELAVGLYEAPTLRVFAKSEPWSAVFEPKGAWVIGARGRVDFVGRLRTQPILYLSAGGPSITSTVSTKGEVLETSTRPFLTGVDRAGWYFIEDIDPKKACRFDRHAFQSLLKRVSGHAPSNQSA